MISSLAVVSQQRGIGKCDLNSGASFLEPKAKKVMLEGGVMNVSIGKELFKDSVYVGVSSDEIVAAFEGVTDVYVGSQSNSSVCFHLCRDSHHLGMFTVSDESATELADTFKALKVYQESKPAALSGAYL